MGSKYSKIGSHTSGLWDLLLIRSFEIGIED